MRFLKSAILATTIIIIFPMAAYAQSGPIDKGSIILGGGFEFGSLSGDLYEYGGEGITTFNFFPEFTYFIKTGLAIGFDLGYSSWSRGDYKESSYGIGPKIVYFFDTNKENTEIKGKFYPYFGASFIYSKLKLDDVYEREATLTTLSALGGGNYMASKSIGIFGHLRYNSNNVNPDEGSSQSGSVFGFEVGVRAFVF